MPSASDRIDFGPPPTRGNLRAFALALVAHALLIAALTWGINWKSQDDAASSFSAELWTSVPQEAAPRQPQPVPTPTPTPVPPPAPKVETPVTPDPDIALAQEKKRKQDEEKRQAAREQAAKEKERQEAAAEEADRKARLAKAEKARDDAKKAQQQKELQAARDAKEAKEEKDAKAKDAEKKAAVAKAAADKQRQDNLKRLQGLAGATGESDGNSTSRASSGGRGTSTTYGAIVRAAVRPNVVFTDEIIGNPTAVVEVRVTLDGSIISHRLYKSSGNKAWDDAAVNAITRTGRMPKDVDGRIPDTTLLVEMKPRG